MLAAVLVGGFAWYERSRPPARMVALVAALAALAVAGRLVLTPIPNVVATTDIVLITGFAVGAAPGFAVGALAAAISNLWLGQGPWTPWEMAGWGVVGLGGAALGAATGRRIGRYGLAVACGFAGFAYGALLDYSVMVSYGGEQSLDRYLAISARGVPFNVAHAAGNVVLALAAGPALVRMIARYRDRFEFRWRPAGAAPLVLLAALAIAVAVPARAHAASAVGWLEGTQNSDGGFGPAPGTSSSATMTGWAVLGLEAAGPQPVRRQERWRDSDRLPAAQGRRPERRGRPGAHDPGPRGRGGELAALRRPKPARRASPPHLRRRLGAGAGQPHRVRDPRPALRGCLAVLGPANRRSGCTAPRIETGAGAFSRAPPATRTAPGRRFRAWQPPARARHTMHSGAAFLRRTQDRDGGFALAGTTVSNAQSTAWAIQGLVAAGVSPSGVREHRHSPFDYLSKRQRGDGHYTYSASSDQTPVWVTGQALVAVRREAFPVRPVARPARHRASSGQGGGGSRGIRRDARVVGLAASDRQQARFQRGRRLVTRGRLEAPGRPGQVGETGRAGLGRLAIAPAPTGTAPRAIGATAQPVSAPVDPAAAPRADGSSHTAAYVAGGLAALALALAGGFLWYRRRLP